MHPTSLTCIPFLISIRDPGPTAVEQVAHGHNSVGTRTLSQRLLWDFTGEGDRLKQKGQDGM